MIIIFYYISCIIHIYQIESNQSQVNTLINCKNTQCNLHFIWSSSSNYIHVSLITLHL